MQANIRSGKHDAHYRLLLRVQAVRQGLMEQEETETTEKLYLLHLSSLFLIMHNDSVI